MITAPRAPSFPALRRWIGPVLRALLVLGALQSASACSTITANLPSPVNEEGRPKVIHPPIIPCCVACPDYWAGRVCGFCCGYVFGSGLTSSTDVPGMPATPDADAPASPFSAAPAKGKAAMRY